VVRKYPRRKGIGPDADTIQVLPTNDLVKQLKKAIKNRAWPRLRELGFDDFTDVAAWRHLDEFIDCLVFQKLRPRFGVAHTLGRGEASRAFLQTPNSHAPQRNLRDLESRSANPKPFHAGMSLDDSPSVDYYGSNPGLPAISKEWRRGLSCTLRNQEGRWNARVKSGELATVCLRKIDQVAIRGLPRRLDPFRNLRKIPIVG
jgi:hypothetical protein